MSERIRTILAVAVLTIAIWVWADLEQTGNDTELMPVRVTVPANWIVRSIEPESVTVTFTGPSGGIRELKASAVDKVCRFDLTEPGLKSSRLVLPARDGFKHWERYRLDVTDVEDDRDDIPDGEIHVTVDRLVRIKVPVRAQVTGAVATAATAMPPDVYAHVAQSDLDKLPEAKRFALAAPLVVSSIPESQQVKGEVALTPRLGGPDGIEATFEPPIVTVTARLKSTLTTKPLGRFQVLICAPPELLNRYRIVFQAEAERWVELEVQGPGPDVERVSPQDIRVQLNLTEDDKPDPDSWLPGKPIVVGLPPTVKLTKPLPTVNFNLEKPAEKPAGP